MLPWGEVFLVYIKRCCYNASQNYGSLGYWWLNFGSVFTVWSVFFGHLFISLQTFVLFFFFAWQYVWFLLFPRQCDEQSNQSTCNQIVITWSLTSGFQVCWKGHCLESALTFCVQIDHVTPHSNWLDFVYFSRVVFFANGQRVTWGFFALMKYFFWTEPKSLLFNITVAYVSPHV